MEKQSLHARTTRFPAALSAVCTGTQLLAPSHLGPRCAHQPHVLARAPCPCGDTIRMVGMFLMPSLHLLGLGTFLPLLLDMLQTYQPQQMATKRQKQDGSHMPFS